jgi:hypothetical protein
MLLWLMHSTCYITGMVSMLDIPCGVSRLASAAKVLLTNTWACPGQNLSGKGVLSLQGYELCLGAHLLNGAVQSHVAVLLVRVVETGSRHISHPDAEVLHCCRILLENLRETPMPESQEPVVLCYQKSDGGVVEVLDFTKLS